MKVINIVTTSLFQIVSLIFLLGYLLGVLNIYFSDRNNYCEMTFMFEYPQFVPITVEGHENCIHSQYRLYAYSEGRFTEKARKMWFDGIPVLFLPGNSGSHMQARSLASVALRKALTKGYDYHFDFFTISFNEEYSGLYGGVLEGETEYAADCITKILSLYKNQQYKKSVPTSVIVIGHSMGGLIAKRLMAYSNTLNTTNLVITLSAPLEAPVINFDNKMNDYYMFMKLEWKRAVNRNKTVMDKKVLISIGSGPRDVLLPAALTSSKDSTIKALTTAIPGVWVSPDHVSMVWCKQLVMVINRFLFDIVDPKTLQITENKSYLTSKAKQYFQANRSMTLDPKVKRQVLPMIMDAFWYEDNRRIYRIARPSIDKTTYLMIRLARFPQNRFVAVEAVNVDDKDWIFGCNAMYTHSTYRYCKNATSLGELSRWSGAAKDFGRRKLATINLHNIMENHPEWTHVIVRVSPTRKPITLNVDINDLASRRIEVDGLMKLWYSKAVLVQETPPNHLYYEILLPGFETVNEAFLLYVEPTASCDAQQYHVTAEMRVPWAENHEHFHYFTHLKRSPMKLRLWKNNPNISLGLEPAQYVKVTVLLDPQCTYTISITTSWYHSLAQLTRMYTPVLLPYVAAIVLQAARHNLLSLKEKGTCVSMHTALMTDTVKPYYSIVFGRLGTVAMMTIPSLIFFYESATWPNGELQYFVKSMLVLPAYMTALGVVNITAAAVLVMMVSSSQLASKLLFRIVWRGGGRLSERLAEGLQAVPMVASLAIVFTVPLACGAAAMAAGAAYYAFMISKLYEEYLEDYFYKLMAKIASRICRMFKSKQKVDKTESETSVALLDNSPTASEPQALNEAKGKKKSEKKSLKERSEPQSDCDKTDETTASVRNDVDDNLTNLNFHMTMFYLWMLVTIVNIPALLTWARNFKYSMILNPDSSRNSGFTLAVCSTFIWQSKGPRRNLKNYDSVATLLFVMAIVIVILGPFTLNVINYAVSFVFAIITLQQIYDIDDVEVEQLFNDTGKDKKNKRKPSKKTPKDGNNDGRNDEAQPNEQPNEQPTGSDDEDKCDVCNESMIYSVFRNLRNKLTFNNDV